MDVVKNVVYVINMPDYLDERIFKCPRCGSHKLIYDVWWDALICCVCENMINVNDEKARV